MIVKASTVKIMLDELSHDDKKEFCKGAIYGAFTGVMVTAWFIWVITLR